MSNLQIIERLCALLEEASKMIRTQAELMEMHGIKTADGVLEEGRKRLLEEIEQFT